MKGKLYPTISLKRPGEYVRVNFGQSPFVFNINAMANVSHYALSRPLAVPLLTTVQRQRQKVQEEISATITRGLEPRMTETDLVQALVLQFLQHDGYVETARAFAEDMRVQKEALNLDPQVQVPGINIRDDEDANNRQREYISGDIKKLTNLSQEYVEPY